MDRFAFLAGDRVARLAEIAADIGAAFRALANAKINATLEGARQKGSWPRKRSGLAICQQNNVLAAHLRD